MRGLRLEGKKESSLPAWTIRRPAPPSKVRLWLSQDPLHALIPCVEIGARVRTGQTLARSKNSLSVDLHASFSGRVTSLGHFVEITSDAQEERMPEVGKERPGWQALNRENLFEILRSSGVALPRPGTGGNVLPGSVLVLNGCESEPYVTSGHALMMSHSVEILKGAEILKKIFGAERVTLALADDKMEAIELMRSKIYSMRLSAHEVKVSPNLYPQDHEEMLRRSLSLGSGASIHAVWAAFAVYEAVVLQKPFYERVVTVGGECVVEPRNVWLRVGTSLAEGFQTCRGLFREPRKILIGGPMRGTAQESLDVPILQSTEAILALPKEVARPLEVEPCIRCRLCVDACPVSLSPVMITLAAERDLFETAREWGAERCIECGNCSYVCPSNRPMLELIRYAVSQ